jgi:hypothetical protein
MTYPMMKTGRPVRDISMKNLGVIYEPNHHDFVTDARWAVFHGLTEDGRMLYAEIAYSPHSGQQVWNVATAVGSPGKKPKASVTEERTYVHALARLQELLASFKAVPGKPSMLN